MTEKEEGPDDTDFSNWANNTSDGQNQPQIDRNLSAFALSKIKSHYDTLIAMRKWLKHSDFEGLDPNPNIRRALNSRDRSAIIDFAKRCGGSPEEIIYDLLIPLGLLVPDKKAASLGGKVAGIWQRVTRKA